VRASCAWVAERAEFVRIEQGAIAGYARDLEAVAVGSSHDPGQRNGADAPTDAALDLGDADREARAGFAVCLNAINFGSVEAEQLLEHGSPAEVELRACAVHAVELLASATAGRLSPPRLDQLLWNRGRGARYKARPRPRCRTTAY
jgi:hypothetical protein